jgi:KipI family sensor histidine kinase inhibitor
MRTRPVGSHALLILLDSTADTLAAQKSVRDLAAGTPSLVPPIDVVPAARTVLLDGLPDAPAIEAWSRALARTDLGTSPEPSGAHGDTVVVDVRYDGADLEVVADLWDCSVEAVVTRHSAVEYVVAFCGFAPGFAYCVPAVPLPAVPRRKEPRARVSAGSVGLAGEYCGVYPAAMPGGWQLIGTTAAVLFDPANDPPALLSPGQRLRFRSGR